jgi:hypothetical protein
LVVRPETVGVERVGAAQQLDFGIGSALPAQFGERVNRRDADAAADAAVRERFLIISRAGLPFILPGNGIAIADDGQHTASGIVLIGVAQAPA